MHSTLEQARGISLRDVLPGGNFIRSADPLITSCTSDWHTVLPGDLYAALVDRHGDGHEHAAKAVQRGAAAVLAERLLPVNAPQCIVPNAQEAYGRVCQALAGNPSRRMRVIGVTGTSGKTTVAILVASVLKAAGATPGSLSSLGYCDAVKIASAKAATPPAADLARWLASMEANGCTHAVVELSSEGLAEYRCAGVELDAAVVTNIRRDHLDLHGSVANYRAIKSRILQHLRPDGFSVLNADDPGCKQLIANIEHPVITVGNDYSAELSATVVELQKSEQTFLLHAGEDSIPVRTAMIGQHHVANCLSAAAVGLVYGIDLPTIVRGIEDAGHIPGRMERVECGQSFGTFLDIANSPESLAQSLKTLRSVTHGRVVCVFDAHGGKNNPQRQTLGRTVERMADLGIITNNDAGDPQPLQAIHDVLDGYRDPERAHVSPNRQEAIRWALGGARPGDTVLIAGTGDAGSTSVLDDDRETAREFLYSLEPAQTNWYPPFSHLKLHQG